MLEIQSGTLLYYIVYINAVAVEFIYLATSAECAGPINPPTALKVLISANILYEMSFF